MKTLELKNLTSFMATVLVEHVEIQDGPTIEWCQRWTELLGNASHVMMEFRLLTDASADNFDGTVLVTHMTNAGDEIFSFTGKYQGISVEGEYEATRQVGSFHQINPA